ncbi:MAG: hypothetical protein JO362_20270 [Streptomycetaceae bacterium]|nr:hypothetical protein [Streptomycetaceae bacterium]
MSDVYRSYTPAEKRQRGLLILRGVRHAYSPEVAKFDRRIERIDAVAEDRGAREAGALYSQHDQAKNEAAKARAAERAAKREDRPAAKQARQQAEQRVKDTERAIRKAGL